MLRCLLLNKKLYLYLLKELDENQEKRIEEHLASCARCQQYLMRLRTIGDAMSQSEKPFLGEVFWRKFDERFSLRLEREQMQKQEPQIMRIRFKSIPRFGIAAAVVVCTLLIVVSVTLKTGLFTPVDYVADQQELVDIALLLEESEELALNHDVDAYIEEVLLQLELEEV